MSSDRVVALALTMLLVSAHGAWAARPRASRPPPPRAPAHAPIEPDVMAAWLAHASEIKDDPPNLQTFAPSQNFPPPRCAVDAPAKVKTGLPRQCFNEDIVTPPDARLIKDATPENRVALAKYFIQRYYLPGFLAIDQFTPTWLIQKTSFGRPGAQDFNYEIGMIRYQLFLEEQEALNIEAFQAKNGRAVDMPPAYESALRLSAMSLIELFRRQRRLVDLWFPDGAAWTALLVAGCDQFGADARIAETDRCCFRQLNGCFPNDAGRVTATPGARRLRMRQPAAARPHRPMKTRR